MGKTWYKKIMADPVKHRALLDLQNKRMHDLRKQIDEIMLKSGGCARCGFSDIRALELHRDDGVQWPKNYYKKLRSIRDGEIKYTILCANCHAIIHNAKSGNMERNNIEKGEGVNG